MAKESRGPSPAFAFLNPPSPLWFRVLVDYHLLLSASRTSWRRRFGCDGVALTIVTTTLVVLGFWERGEMAYRNHSKRYAEQADCSIPLFKLGSRSVVAVPIAFPSKGRVYMERSTAVESADRIHLESVLRNWFAQQGVSEAGASRAVVLLDASTLLSQPRPSRWNRRGTFGVQERCRYLWYRHAARILGWCDRRRFPGEVTAILRGHIFPCQGGRDETTREDGEARVTACAPAGSTAVATHSTAIADGQPVAGKSSCILTHHAPVANV